MKTILKLAFVLVIGILVYNYFYGDASERKQSEQIFQDVKELGVTVTDLLKEEHQKYKDGKYDQVLDNLKDAYSKIESQAKSLSPEVRSQLETLKEKREDLQNNMDKDKTEEEVEKYKKELKKLLEETDEMVKNMDG